MSNEIDRVGVFVVFQSMAIRFDHISAYQTEPMQSGVERSRVYLVGGASLLVDVPVLEIQKKCQLAAKMIAAGGGGSV